MAIYCFDLDDTICFPNHAFSDSERKYTRALPNDNMIEKLRDVHANGHKIIIFTARRMLTHGGDIDAIKRDVGQVTKGWLIRHEVPYDELIFGKPYADFYIDDKAVNVIDFEEPSA